MSIWKWVFDMHKCPYCKSPIHHGAKKCHECKENIAVFNSIKDNEKRYYMAFYFIVVIIISILFDLQQRPILIDWITIFIKGEWTMSDFINLIKLPIWRLIAFFFILFFLYWTDYLKKILIGTIVWCFAIIANNHLIYQYWYILETRNSKNNIQNQDSSILAHKTSLSDNLIFTWNSAPIINSWIELTWSELTWFDKEWMLTQIIVDNLNNDIDNNSIDTQHFVAWDSQENSYYFWDVWIRFDFGNESWYNVNMINGSIIVTHLDWSQYNIKPYICETWFQTIDCAEKQNNYISNSTQSFEMNWLKYFNIDSNWEMFNWNDWWYDISWNNTLKIKEFAKYISKYIHPKNNKNMIAFETANWFTLYIINKFAYGSSNLIIPENFWNPNITCNYKINIINYKNSDELNIAPDIEIYTCDITNELNINSFIAKNKLYYRIWKSTRKSFFIRISNSDYTDIDKFIELY